MNIELLTGDQYKTDQETLLDALQRDLPTEADNNSLKTEIAQIDRKLARVTNAIADLDIPPSTLILKLKELEEEKQEKKRQLAESEKGIDLDKIRSTSDRIRDSILSVLQNENSTPDALRDAVFLFIHSVVIYPDKQVLIRHTLPGMVASTTSGDVSAPPRAVSAYSQLLESWCYA